MGLTLGWGPRTIIGRWLDTRTRRWTLNLLGFGMHWQIRTSVTVDRWHRGR